MLNLKNNIMRHRSLLLIILSIICFTTFSVQANDKDWSIIDAEWVDYKLPPKWSVLKSLDEGPINRGNKDGQRFHSYYTDNGYNDSFEMTICFEKNIPVDMNDLSIDDVKYWSEVGSYVKTTVWSEAAENGDIKGSQSMTNEYYRRGQHFLDNCKRIIYLRKVGANVYSMIVTIPYAKITPELEKDIEAIYKSWKVKN